MEVYPYLVWFLFENFAILSDVLSGDDVFPCFDDHVQQFLDGGHASLPVVRLHGLRDLHVVVEKAGHDGELDLDGHAHSQLILLRDIEQLGKQLCLLFPAKKRGNKRLVEIQGTLE